MTDKLTEIANQVYHLIYHSKTRPARCSGEPVISYDCGNGKSALCSVKSGDETESVTDNLPDGTVYIIIETDGKCGNGKFRFDLK